MRADPMRADLGMRLLRAGVFAAVCMAVSVLGHVAASGAGLAWWALPAGWLATVCLVTPLAGRERSRAGITATLLCGQMILHVVFCLAQRPATASPPEGTATAVHGHASHAMAAHLMPGPVMFAVHLAAALLLGWLVHRGERAVWRLVRASLRTAGALAWRLAAVFAPAVLCPPGVRVRMGRRWEAQPARVEVLLLEYAVVRRGPPGIAAA